MNTQNLTVILMTLSISTSQILLTSFGSSNEVTQQSMANETAAPVCHDTTELTLSFPEIAPENNDEVQYLEARHQYVISKQAEKENTNENTK